MYPHVPSRLSHELAHYRFRFPSSSIITHKFSCRLPLICTSTARRFRDAGHPERQKAHVSAGTVLGEDLHTDTRSAAARSRLAS